MTDKQEFTIDKNKYSEIGRIWWNSLGCHKNDEEKYIRQMSKIIEEEFYRFSGVEKRCNELVQITDDCFSMMNEIYDSFYTCPNCKEDMIMSGASYCQDCGIKLEWNIGHDEGETSDY